ncbi:alpha/beta hydrolase [Butyrivibrio sp. LC3010]|uniref:alpha/beta hydrolase n=1 Tax=Butyrivibrio sp. LC3010 TaxID=1280680 RepID=UPI0003FEC313|nr:alpha/beta hydrolase [Butyrivibrio sp. LC3010]
MKKAGNIIKRSIVVIISILIVLAIAFKIYTTQYYRADIGIIDNIENLLSGSVHSYSDKNGTVFIPENKDIKAVIVFYPGGKVEYSSYNGLMYELAARGFICLLPKMPENLALLRIDAVNRLTSGYQDYISETSDLDWYLAGHSLGGVAACAYIKNTLAEDKNKSADQTNAPQPDYRGIILCASYPTADLSNTELRLLSLYGSNDKVLDMSKYNESKKNWPSDSEEHIIDGGIHSYFGSYGIQNKDGSPEISNYEQIIQTADIIADWITR